MSKNQLRIQIKSANLTPELLEAGLMEMFKKDALHSTIVIRYLNIGGTPMSNHLEQVLVLSEVIPEDKLKNGLASYEVFSEYVTLISTCSFIIMNATATNISTLH